jgi:hypothetical protein
MQLTLQQAVAHSVSRTINIKTIELQPDPLGGTGQALVLGALVGFQILHFHRLKATLRLLRVIRTKGSWSENEQTRAWLTVILAALLRLLQRLPIRL